MKTCYIAGKITGFDNYKMIFAVAERMALKQGFKVMNPAVLGEGFSYDKYLPICLAMLDACDTVCMLPNWRDSKGAALEENYARIQGKTIVYMSAEELSNLRPYVFNEYEPKEVPTLPRRQRDE